MRLLHPVPRDVTPEDLFDLYDAPGAQVRAGFVASVDGAVAVRGTSAPLGSPADKAVFRALRAVCDVVVVGAGTARDEDYGPVRLSEAAAAWRAAHGRPAQVPLVVVSRRGDVAPDARFREGPWELAGPGGTLPSDPEALVAALHGRGQLRVLCEGGPSLLTSWLQARVVDELCLTTSPSLVGDGPHLLGEVPRADLRLVSLVHDDPGVLLARWAVLHD